MHNSAKKILLPRLIVTELSKANEANAQQVQLPDTLTASEMIYYVTPKFANSDDQAAITNQPMVSCFNLFPIVLSSDGTPWAEANIYLLSKLENALNPRMSTYSSIADDLAAYRRFLDETSIDWTFFPKNKLKRPTYRYSSNLNTAISIGEVAATTAKRRMSNIISFYKWLKCEGALIPEHQPWIESNLYITFKSSFGSKITKQISKTDISIQTAHQVDPYSETIDDGDKLRPLPLEEQKCLVDALNEIGNTEMTLIHLFGLITGARLQSILTIRVKHVLMDLKHAGQNEILLPIGPGTEIDTKNDKQLVLHIPIWFYHMLQTYATSERASKRMQKTSLGSCAEQYLFLSIRGAPLYQSKSETKSFDNENELRHAKNGQAVRQFITERLIPLIRKSNNNSKFHFKFHDTRATFGMNLTDFALKKVSAGEISLHEAREYVKTRMGHESSATTDRYLQYRKNLKLVRDIADKHDCHLRQLIEKAMKGSL